MTIINYDGISGINSITSVGGGVKFYDTTGASSFTITPSGTGGATLGDVTVSSINSGPIAGPRNRVINGDMRIDQRNAGASVTPTYNSYGLDRWSFPVSQNSKMTAQQSTVVPSGFTNSMVITSSSAYSVLSSDYFGLQQKVEGFNVADLGWGAAGAQSVTLSFWVRSSLTGTWGGVIGNSNGSRNYPFTYTINAANTWEYKTVTISGDTTGTWSAGNGTGVNVQFGFGAGSSWSGTAEAWTGTQAFSATGAVSLVGTNGATFYITGVQLEPGTVATPFERRSYGQELALCQRYYEVVSALGGTYNGTGGSLMLSFATFWKVTKRTAPTATVSTGATQSVDVSNITTYQGSITSGSWYNPGTITASAEL